MKQTQIIFLKIFTVLLFLNMATYAQNRIDTLLLSMQHHLFLENISMRGSTTISNSAAVDFSTPANGGMAIGYRIVPRITKSSAIGIGISLGMINQESINCLRIISLSLMITKVHIQKVMRFTNLL
jgi:hypothetical protein